MKSKGWVRKDYKEWWGRCSFCHEDVHAGWVRNFEDVRFETISVELNDGIKIVVDGHGRHNSVGQVFMCDDCTPKQARACEK